LKAHSNFQTVSLGTSVNKTCRVRWASSGGIMDVADLSKKIAGRQGGNSTPMTAKEEMNKALVRRLFEAAGAGGDLDVLEELLAPDFVDHNPLPGQEPGRAGYMQFVAHDHDVFSDLRYFFHEQLAVGDKVISRLTARATHDWEKFMGLALTGKEVTYKGIIIHRISGGKIAEEWSHGNVVGETMEKRLEEQARERERVEQELRVARAIQQASLPKEVPQLEGWQISPFYQPAREVGGDFYDFLELDDGRLGLVVGDATGKGVPAALVMASARSMLRAVTQGSESPGKVLTRINDPLVSDIPPNMFVTCFYCILDPKSGHLVYANAGHDLPYVHRVGDDSEELRARGMPLGLMPGMSYEQKEIVLEPGDIALLYSDGLVEAHDPKGGCSASPGCGS
jgi:predicted ester cyclase